MEKHEDSLLVSLLNENNVHAFEMLYGRYSAKLYNSILLILYNKELVRDIVQNCFLIIWEKRGQLDPQKSFPAYLYTIARNLVYKEAERLILHNKFVDSKINETTTTEESVVDDLTNAHIEEHIERSVNELPQIPQTIFRMKRDQNLSNKEIANQLNISERAVEAHFYRTIKLLKERLRHFIVLFL